MSFNPRDEIEDARIAFRQHVADQLRNAADRAGLPARITEDRDRIVLQLEDPSAGEDFPSFVVLFGEGNSADGGDSLTLCVETAEERATLLRLEWQDQPGPTEERALARELAALTSRFKQVARHTRRTPQNRGALVPAEPDPRAVAKTERLERIPERHERPLRPSQNAGVELQRANLSEMLIAGLIQAMRRDLAEAESHFIKPGIAASVGARFGRGMEWAALVTAYGAEAQTNQIAIASLLGGTAASWLYGLVGPVLIAGLASLAKSKAGKGAAYTLMGAWALAMATIAASEPGFLDRAQALAPKHAPVLTQEHAVAAARVRKDATEAALKGLSAPLDDATALVTSAKKRWQAKEIMSAAKQQQDKRAKDIAQAQKDATAAGIALSDEELRLRRAMLDDPSRAWAWWTLFVVFGVINFAGPLTISRLLERWKDDNSQAQADAREGHLKKSEADALRGSRPAQKAHAMLLLPPLLDRLKNDGVPPDLIAALDLGDIAEKAADHFDGALNTKPAPQSSFRYSAPAPPA
jgi:hypothetical protein